MEILRILMLKEKRQIPATSIYNPWAIPIMTKPVMNVRKEAISGFRLSKRDTSHPEMGSPIRELTGMASNKFPSSASLRSKVVFIVGILDAQVENAKPDMKKKILRPRRCFF